MRHALCFISSFVVFFATEHFASSQDITESAFLSRWEQLNSPPVVADIKLDGSRGEVEVDLGERLIGSMVGLTCKIENRNEHPLDFGVESTCGCTVGLPKVLPISVGDTKQLKVIVSFPAESSSVSTSVILHDSKRELAFRIQIKGLALNRFLLAPDGFKFDSDELAVRQITIKDQIDGASIVSADLLDLDRDWLKLTESKRKDDGSCDLSFRFAVKDIRDASDQVSVKILNSKGDAEIRLIPLSLSHRTTCLPKIALFRESADNVSFANIVISGFASDKLQRSTEGFRVTLKQGEHEFPVDTRVRVNNNRVLVMMRLEREVMVTLSNSDIQDRSSRTLEFSLQDERILVVPFQIEDR